MIAELVTAVALAFGPAPAIGPAPATATVIPTTQDALRAYINVSIGITASAISYGAGVEIFRYRAEVVILESAEGLRPEHEAMHMALGYMKACQAEVPKLKEDLLRRHDELKGIEQRLEQRFPKIATEPQYVKHKDLAHEVLSALFAKQDYCTWGAA